MASFGYHLIVPSTNVAMSQTLHLNLDQIKINHERFRLGLGEESNQARIAFDELKDSLSRNGQINPVLVTDNRDGTYELVAGYRRYNAVRDLGWPTVAVWVRDELDDYQRREIELEENICRLDMSWLEQERAIVELDRIRRDRDPAWGQANTANLIGKHQSDVSRAKALVRAVDMFPELAKAKSKSQALSWAKTKATNAGRVIDVARKEIEYALVADKILLGDSVEIIKTLPSDWIDLVLTDPPFGINYEQRTSGTVGEVSSYVDDEASYRRLLTMAPELYRVIRSSGWLVWFLGISWYEEAKRAFRLAGFTVDEIPIVWDRSDGRTFTSRPDRWFPRGYDIALHCLKGQPHIVKREGSNVLRVKPVGSDERDLLVERPIELYQQIIERLTVPGELVADFFAGSGSCPAAAVLSGRDYIAVELDSERRAKAIQKVHANTPVDAE